MKKSVLLATLLLGLATVASGKSFDERLEGECRYMMGDKDEGRYDSEAHGYSLGVVTGAIMMTPKAQRSETAKKSLGYISDYACMLALKEKSDKPFIFKYQDAVGALVVK